MLNPPSFPTPARAPLLRRTVGGPFNSPPPSTPWRVGEEPMRWDVSFSGLVVDEIRRRLGRLLKRTPTPILRTAPAPCARAGPIRRRAA